MTVRTSSLRPSKITSIVGAAANCFSGQVNIVPQWKRGMSNATTSSGRGEYDGGDRVLGFGGYAVDGDLLLTVGWGDGFAIRRLNDAGTMTRLYYESHALYRNTTLKYNHVHSLAFHKASGKCAIGSHNVYGYSIIDYSDLQTGGTAVVNTRPPTKYIFNTGGVAIDRVGVAYCSGMITAGDWLYLGDYDSTHYKKYPRRHWVTDEEQLLDGTSAANIYPGSTPIDRNGYRYVMFYDEINDRVFYCSHYNGNFMMITDASTDNPKCVWCDMADAGLGDDAYEHGLFIPDPVNEPNKLSIGCNSRHALVDVTPCLSGLTATVIKQFFTSNTEMGANYPIFFRAGTNRQSTTGDWIDKNPLYTDFHPTSSDRGKNSLDGWIDHDNSKVVGLLQHNTVVEDTSTDGRGRSYRSSYSNPIFRMLSTGGTPWWIKTGYGYDGHSFKIWDDSIGNLLIPNWSVEYGTFRNTGEAIEIVYLSLAGHYTPSGCSISYFVSNNGGTSWEAYNPESESNHIFASSGNALKVKFIASGFPNKSPYKVSSDLDTATYGSIYAGGTNINIPTKVSSFKITGRK